MTMRLLLRGPSPFGRKCAFSIKHLQLSDQIGIGVPESEDHIRNFNPLAKVPTLIVDDGEALFDSRVILEYLDHITGGGKIIPIEAAARFKTLRLAALADGILESALLITYEARYRPDQTPYEPWIDFQRGKIQRALSAMSDLLPATNPPMVDGIGLGCALEYMDFRKQYDWRAEFPALVGWIDDFHVSNPIFASTRPSS